LHHDFHVRITNPTGGLVMSKKNDAVVSFVPDQTVSRITQEAGAYTRPLFSST